MAPRSLSLRDAHAEGSGSAAEISAPFDVNITGRMVEGAYGNVFVKMVVAVQYCAIATMLQTVQRVPTPLQRRLDQLGRRLALVAIALVALIFVLGLARGENLKVMFLTAVSMAVAAVPEGLPAVVTIALALGAQRMLRRRALIRKLAAVETWAL